MSDFEVIIMVIMGLFIFRSLLNLITGSLLISIAVVIGLVITGAFFFGVNGLTALYLLSN